MKINMKNIKKISWPIWPWKNCNLNCWYCIVKHNDENVQKHYRSKTYDEIKNILDYYKSISLEWGVSYDWWEITIFPYFLDILEYWKKIWIKQTITTNWVKFSDINLANKIKERWVNSVNLSIHTYIAKKQDYISWNIIHFKKSVQWWDNLLKKGIYVDINFVIMKDNVNDILWFYIFSLKRIPRMINLSLFFNTIHNNEVDDKILKFSENPEKIGQNIAKMLYFKKQVDFKAGKEVIPIYFYNIPFCIINNTNFKREDAVKFFSNMPLLENNPIASCVSPSSFDRFEENDIFYEFYKKDSCKKCSLNNRCPGIPLWYKIIFWDNYLIPFE